MRQARSAKNLCPERVSIPLLSARIVAANAMEFDHAGHRKSHPQVELGGVMVFGADMEKDSYGIARSGSELRSRFLLEVKR